MAPMYPVLFEVMRTRGVAAKDIADYINQTEETVCQKIEGTQEWTLNEAVAVCAYLHYPDIKLLFLQLDSKSNKP